MHRLCRSQSFRVGYVLRLFCWIPDSLRKVPKNFESLYQPDELVGKPNQPIYWNNSLGLWHRLCRFSVIRSRICTPFAFLDS